MKQTCWKRIHKNNKVIKYKYWDTHIYILCIFYMLHMYLLIFYFYVFKIFLKYIFCTWNRHKATYKWWCSLWLPDWRYTKGRSSPAHLPNSIKNISEYVDFVAIHFLWAHSLLRHWNSVGYIWGFLTISIGKKPQSPEHFPKYHIPYGVFIA